MEELSLCAARRLALARAGLWKRTWTGLSDRASGSGRRARQAALDVIERFGYLQLDTVSIAGARSHVLVLLSRYEGLAPELGEELLRPGEPLFEYWGHEASWLPLALYPVFAFRRQALREHPWWGDVVGAHPAVAERLLARIEDEGPLRSVDMEGRGSRGWWDLKLAKKVATALWSSGELAIRERTNFQRSYDLASRVVPSALRARATPFEEALEVLLEKALDGHGWATTGTLAATWRLRNCASAIEAALERMRERGAVVTCALVDEDGDRRRGWVRPGDLALADRLTRARPRPDQGVLLSPFDPLIWDRARVLRLFGFEQRLEIFKPAAERVWGYYCMPVLAGERLVARYDLKADRARGRLQVLALHFEGPAGPAGPAGLGGLGGLGGPGGPGGPQQRAASAADAEAARTALARHADALALRVAR